MDYKKTFSYCLKNEFPESKHQFHYDYNYEPTEYDFERWLIGKLFSVILIEKVGEFITTVGYDYPIEKEKQIHNFLDFHFSKYKSSLNNFKLSLELVMELAKSNPDVNTNTLFFNGIKGFILDWMKQKIDDRKAIITVKKMNFTPICKPDKIEEVYSLLSNGYLSEISDRRHFDYVFGMIDSCDNFKLLNWIKPIKDLSYFIYTFYDEESQKWEKAIQCFTWYNKTINKKSLSTAYNKDHDVLPKGNLDFVKLKKKLNK